MHAPGSAGTFCSACLALRADENRHFETVKKILEKGYAERKCILPLMAIEQLRKSLIIWR